MNNILCVIPARGGSKRIPKKNIKEFFGKPLIAYSIEVARESNLFDKIIVSTDDDKIAKIAKEYGAEVQIRPAKLSDDYTGTFEVVNYVVNKLKQEGFNSDYVCIIYPTAPLLQKEYLIEGFNKLKDSSACYSFSATSYEAPTWWAFKIKDNRCEAISKEYFNIRSQDLEETFYDAGQFYWEKVGCNSDDIFFGKDSIPIILPRYLVQDIDTLEDWKRAEVMYRILNQNSIAKE
jgi:pseudaminic acid cytidylyltransferase